MKHSVAVSDTLELGRVGQSMQSANKSNVDAGCGSKGFACGCNGLPTTIGPRKWLCCRQTANPASWEPSRASHSHCRIWEESLKKNRSDSSKIIYYLGL